MAINSIQNVQFLPTLAKESHPQVQQDSLQPNNTNRTSIPVDDIDKQFLEQLKLAFSQTRPSPEVRAHQATKKAQEFSNAAKEFRNKAESYFNEVSKSAETILNEVKGILTSRIERREDGNWANGKKISMSKNEDGSYRLTEYDNEGKEFRISNFSVDEHNVPEIESVCEKGAKIDKKYFYSKNMISAYQEVLPTSNPNFTVLEKNLFWRDPELFSTEPDGKRKSPEPSSYKEGVCKMETSEGECTTISKVIDFPCMPLCCDWSYAEGSSFNTRGKTLGPDWVWDVNINKMICLVGEEITEYQEGLKKCSTYNMSSENLASGLYFSNGKPSKYVEGKAEKEGTLRERKSDLTLEMNEKEGWKPANPE